MSTPSKYHPTIRKFVLSPRTEGMFSMVKEIIEKDLGHKITQENVLEFLINNAVKNAQKTETESSDAT